MANSRLTLTEPGRLILGLMVFTITFSLVGGEIEKNQNKPQTVSPFTIIFGGTVATSLLTLVSHAGDIGERFAVGLATIAFVTSALVYGKPVWDAANKAVGSQPGARGTLGTGPGPIGTPTAIAAESTTVIVPQNAYLPAAAAAAAAG